jgi:hypothetical protein
VTTSARTYTTRWGSIRKTDKESSMAKGPGHRHPLGKYEAELEATVALLRAYFAAGIPVIVSADGLTFRPERRLPRDVEGSE